MSAEENSLLGAGDQSDFSLFSDGAFCLSMSGIKIYDSNEKHLVFEPSVRWAGNPNIILVLKLFSLNIKVQVRNF